MNVIEFAEYVAGRWREDAEAHRNAQVSFVDNQARATVLDTWASRIAETAALTPAVSVADFVAGCALGMRASEDLYDLKDVRLAMLRAIHTDLERLAEDYGKGLLPYAH